MAIIVQQFDHPTTVQTAVEALRVAGIAEEQIGFLTKMGIEGQFEVPTEMNPEDLSGKQGAAFGTVAGVLTAAAAMMTPFGPLVAAGPLFGTLIGALAGATTGGTVASLVKGEVNETVVEQLTKALEHDHALFISVNVPNRREKEIRALLQQTIDSHADEHIFFKAYHEQHSKTDFNAVNHAYHYGYGAATVHDLRPFAEVEPALRRKYPANFEADREAIKVGYQRALTIAEAVH